MVTDNEGLPSEKLTAADWDALAIAGEGLIVLPPQVTAFDFSEDEEL